MAAEHPFGDAVPGEAVPVREPQHFGHGYRPRGRYILKTVGTGYIREDADSPRKDHTVTTAIAERSTPIPTDQIELVRRTVAVGATNDELALYLYDCQRRGIHPLDKLLHFTKRGGKYTPVTSIDFMRAQAAMSGEMAGSDDPVFTMDGTKLEAATVTVYRLTQGQRFAYAATARWSEYCPDNAQMWRRMPHTMLGKCAEALALRKAFPQQLAGLYSTEEMQQADAPISRLPDPSQADNKPRQPSVGYEAAVVNQGANPTPAPSDDGPDLGTADIPGGFRLIDDYQLDGDWHIVTWGRDAQGGWMTYKTKLAKIGLAAHNAFTERIPVLLHSNKFPFLDKVEKLGITPAEIKASKFKHDDPDYCAGCGKPLQVCDCGSF